MRGKASAHVGLSSSQRALALILDFARGGTKRGSPRGKRFKQTEQTRRAEHEAEWVPCTLTEADQRMGELKHRS